MNERFPTKTEDRRPGFHPERIKTQADLEKYGKELLEWSNTQDLDVQKAHVEFAKKLKELIEADEEPTEEQITQLHEKLPVVDKKERLSPEVLGRYYQRVLAQLGLLRENARISHSELYQKSSGLRDDKYADLYGRLTALGNRIEKIKADPDSVEDQEIEDIFHTLTKNFNVMKEKLEGLKKEDKEEGEDEEEEKDDDKEPEYHEVSEEEIAHLRQAYEQADDVNDKSNAAVSLVQARVADFKHTFSTFETENDVGKEQASKAISALGDRLNSFISELHGREELTKERVENLTEKVLKFLDRIDELVQEQNQRHQASEDGLTELIPELKQHLGLMSDSESLITDESYNQFEQMVSGQYAELLKTIEGNDNLSDEFKEGLKAKAMSARNEYITTVGDLQADVDSGEQEVVSKESDLSNALENWSSAYREIMLKVSPEFQIWQEAKSLHKEARKNYHKELERVQEENRTGIMSLFGKKADTSKLEELGRVFERTEQKYITALDKYMSMKRDQRPDNELSSEAVIPGKYNGEDFEVKIDQSKEAREERYENTKLKTLGAWEGKALAMREDPKTHKIFERLEPLQKKLSKIKPWQRYAIGLTVIGGFAAGSVVAGAGTAAAAAIGVVPRVVRLTASTGFGGLMGGFSFGKLFSERRFKKEQTKVDAAKENIDKAQDGVLKEGGAETTVADFRNLIRERNMDYIMALRAQKRKSIRDGMVAGAATGAVVGGAANLAFDDWYSDTLVPAENAPDYTDSLDAGRGIGDGDNPSTSTSQDFESSIGSVETSSETPQVGEPGPEPDVPRTGDSVPQPETPSEEMSPVSPAPESEVRTPETPPPPSNEAANTLGGENYKSDSKSAADFLKTETNEEGPAPEPQPETEAVPAPEQSAEGESGGETVIENVATDLETLTHETVKGDWVSKKLIDFYPQYFADLSESQWNEFIASVENNPELLKNAGVSSGDLDLIKPGEEIRYDVLAEHYINNVTGEGLRDATIPSSGSAAESSIDNSSATEAPAAKTIPEEQPETPAGPVSPVEGMLANQPPEVLDEVNSRIDSSMSESEQAELVGTILERNALIRAMEGEASEGVMATLNDMSLNELDQAIKQGGFTGWLSENNLADAKFADLLRQMSEAGLLKGDSLFEAIENAMAENRVRLILNGIGEESAQVRRVGLFGTKGGWNAPINSVSA